MNTKTDSLGSRVLFARKRAQMSQTALAKKIGASQGTVAHIENGRNNETKHIVELARVLRVRAEWLATGEGEMVENWPFLRVDKSDFESLPTDVKEDIEDYIEMKIFKNKDIKSKSVA